MTVGFILGLLAFLDFFLGLMVYEDGKRERLMQRCLSLIKTRFRVSYDEMRNEVGSEKTANEIISRLLDNGMITIKEEGQQKFFVLDQGPEGADYDYASD